MVQQGQATTIYIAKDEYKRYQTIVKEKLGKKAGPRIVELIRQDVANLEGKPVIDNNEDINELQTRLKSLIKEEDDAKRILEQHEVLDHLVHLSQHSPYNISFKRHPDKAKKAIAMMVTDFNAGKIRADLGDFQLFIGYAELHIEYCKVLSRLAELRAQKYTADPTQTPETEAPQIEAQPAESAEIKQVAKEAEGQEPEVKANNKQSTLEEPESEEEEEGAGKEKEDEAEEPEPGEDEPNDDYVLELAEEKEEEEPWLD